FALVAPVLFLVLFGTLDFGKTFNYWIDETHLAAEGARLAVVNHDVATGNNGGPDRCPNGSTPPTLQAYIQCQADTTQLASGAIVCIWFPNGTSNNGDPVEVDIKWTHTWIPLIGRAVGQLGTLTLKGTATMRLETA